MDITIKVSFEEARKHSIGVAVWHAWQEQVGFENDLEVKTMVFKQWKDGKLDLNLPETTIQKILVKRSRRSLEL